MGLRSRLARWLQPTATPMPTAAAASARGADPLAEVLRDHLQRIEKLELDRPAFVTALEEIAERCHDILDTSEARRARVAARESKMKKREHREDEQTEAQLELGDTVHAMADREAIKAQVRQRLRMQGKLH
jgi:hypothetical protein